MATKKTPAKTKASTPVTKAAPKAKAAPKKAAPAAKAAPKSTAAKVAPTSKSAIEIGKPAPAFSLLADDGATVTLDGLRGKNVVLYFYPKDDTPGCTKEACGFRDIAGDFAKKNAVVFGVSKDSVASHTKFKNKYHLNFGLLSDPTGEMIAKYGSWGQKKFMGRTFDGILRTTVLVDESGNVSKVYPKVSPETHAEQILGDLG